MGILALLLFIAAFFVFLVAMIVETLGRVRLIALGLALFTLAYLLAAGLHVEAG